jgi:periplasmic copper chaperone A
VPHPMSLRNPARGAVAVAAATLLAVAVALPAAAHVTVSSPDAAPGGFGKVVVRVPTESDTVSTTEVAVRLPADTPFAFVSTKPHPGWTVATTERTLDEPVTADGFTLTKAVATVTWTATGSGIGPGEFDEFEISVGPFPSGVETVTLPTTQTYSDGSVVAWDQPVTGGADEPEHPAPVLALSGSANEDTTTSDASTDAGDARGDAAAAAAPVEDGYDPLARWLAAGALVAALAGLGIALVTARRRAA